MLRPVVAVLSALAVAAAVLVPAAPAAADLPKPDYAEAPTVLINEIAGSSARSEADSFLELRNWGDEAVELTGWAIYRCSAIGLRRNVGQAEADLRGITLPPGGILTISRVGLPGDLHFTGGYAAAGYGAYLEAPDGSVVDMVGVYPNQPWPMTTECTPPGGNLPRVLDSAQDESWQRIAATGDPAADWIEAPATIDAPNAQAAPAESVSPVVISEIAATGPAGGSDGFVELRNDGPSVVDLGGWTIWRCTGSGALRPETLQLEVPQGVELAPGDLWVIGGEGFTGEAALRWPTSLADREFGLLIRDADGRLVDRVAVSHYADSPCQDPKLPAILDAPAGESYQLTDAGDWVAAPRTPGAANAQVADALFGSRAAVEGTTPDATAGPTDPAGVAISELATDPSGEGMPAGLERRNYVELGNYGDDPVDVSGWTVWRCMADGARALEPQAVIPAGTVLSPGATWLLALAGTPAAARADQSYDTALSMLGTGIWLTDADGAPVDSVGVYGTNEMDQDNVTPSPCSNGVALTTYQPDRLLGETFRRSRFTGSDIDDFVTGPATPGVLDLVPWVDPTARVAVVADIPRAAAPTTAAPAGDDAAVPTQPARVLAVWGGVTDGAPLDSRVGADEVGLDPSAPGPVADDAYGLPYQRIELDGTALLAGGTVGWRGTTTGRAELQLSVWTGESWRLLDAAAGSPDDAAVGDGPAEVALAGAVHADEVLDGMVTLLVQSGPRTVATLEHAEDGAFDDRSAYDFAISHVTDTQYLAESYPEVYAEELSWIAANADAREIAFATHTGDLVQNWVDPAQNDIRARLEFERASAIQSILDEAGIPNSVLPGNHDNIRGASADLFNEYFPPERYADTEWYGGSIAPGDNSANFSTFEHSGARFLMLSLPYAYGEREIAWAEEVVAAHPDHNVIISTHEHVMPKMEDAPAHRASSARWISRAGELWDRVIAPNRNVVLVLAGHFHGIGQLVTEDAGGIPGHTVVELLADYQEFRTHTGERATGFQRLLQVDLASGSIAVDTFSVRLDADASADYDYRQFALENGSALTGSNVRPWRILATGLQHRYTAEDDQFVATVAFQYPKLVETVAVTAEPTTATASGRARVS